MSDVFSRTKRSYVMSKIRSSGNKDTELAAIAFFRLNRIRGWRRAQKLFGKPDFVFPRRKVAVFVDGCFWHFCPIHGTKPKGNSEYWEKKLVANTKRATLVNRTLKAKGWKVIRIWEHELATKSQKRLLAKVLKILKD